MALEKEKKKNLIDNFATKDGDTGSPEVQVAILTERMQQLSSHLQTHKKDFHSRRGLLRMVSKRRKLLSFLKQMDEKRYTQLIKRLNLKK